MNEWDDRFSVREIYGALFFFIFLVWNAFFIGSLGETYLSIMVALPLPF